MRSVSTDMNCLTVKFFTAYMLPLKERIYVLIKFKTVTFILITLNMNMNYATTLSKD